ncbi:DNA repair protein RecN [Oscillospiraceae bacterium LCP25S3_E10]|nr:DNA repair protein RecN [Ruminococcus sp.]MDD6447805.1 DNA repair protein RecN [Ruminococcus sp.]MDY2855570.1 DNA repair protein RecN [Oscillospiraceae bacterium]
MLNSLYIENIAVIEKTNIDFTKGFNVLTGETGAGKSIIIGSINALLGGRISKDIIRSGADTAFVSGSFSVTNPQVYSLLEQYGFECDRDDQLILQRKLTANGKSSCRINGKPANLAVLKEITAHLVNVHGQHESYNLMSPEKHIEYIDSIGELDSIKKEYRENLAILRDYRKKLKSAQTDDSQRERQIDLLRYQINEIEQAAPQEGEYEQLTEERSKAQNAQDIIKSLSEAEAILAGEEQVNGCIDTLRECSDCIGRVSEYVPVTEKLSERITNVYYELQDCAEEISSILEGIDTDPYRLQEIEERLDVLYRLSKKYGSTTAEILEFCENAKGQLQQLEDYEFNMESLQKDYDKYFQATKELALKLSAERKKISREFALKVKEEMTYLDMPNVNLEVSIERCPLNENGCDKLEFLISANPGEAPKPVSKIASGGELSRMMLAITNVIASHNIVSTMIFDEVDTGISGSASQKVGYKLKALSETRQVICITHQAQIAALADTHFLIKKNVENNRTFTQVSELSFEDRVRELARIIGGVSITELTLKHAEEMLLQSKNKNEI